MKYALLLLAAVATLWAAPPAMAADGPLFTCVSAATNVCRFRIFYSTRGDRIVVLPGGTKQNVPGVTRFIGSGQSAIALKENEVRRVLGQMEATKTKPTPTVSFRVGDHVRVVDGPFSAFTGVVDEVNGERGKVKVMVSIFGRATPVELDFLQVQPV